MVGKMPHELNMDDEFLSLLRFCCRSLFFSFSPNGVPISTIMIGMWVIHSREGARGGERQTKMHLTGAYNVPCGHFIIVFINPFAVVINNLSFFGVRK